MTEMTEIVQRVRNIGALGSLEELEGYRAGMKLRGAPARPEELAALRDREAELRAMARLLPGRV